MRVTSWEAWQVRQADWLMVNWAHKTSSAHNVAREREMQVDLFVV